jgi:uncharacterized membrane protein YraQ (UPF0718 family)
MNAFIPMTWMKNQLGQNDLKSVVKAAMFGAPLPLCSCGVIPAAVGLRKAGASKAATTSFLVSTPETGVDSISLSYALMGPVMAIVRPVAAITSAIAAGLLVGRETAEDRVKASDFQTSKSVGRAEADSGSSAKSCCSKKEVTPAVEPVAEQVVSSCCSKEKVEKTIEESTSKSGCCGSKKSDEAQTSEPNIAKRLKAAFVYATGNLIENTVVWLIIGLGFAALIQTYLPKDFLTQWGDSFITMLVMILISVPMYICATASTPIAAGLMLAGVSPGAVLVFMLAGPATNIATLGVITNELGKRALVGYLGGVIGGALSFGLLLDYALENSALSVVPAHIHDHSTVENWIAIICAVILGAFFIKAIVKIISEKLSSLRVQSV